MSALPYSSPPYHENAASPAAACLGFAYEHTDVPPGLTLVEWRRARRPPRRPGRLARVRAAIHV